MITIKRHLEHERLFPNELIELMMTGEVIFITNGEPDPSAADVIEVEIKEYDVSAIIKYFDKYDTTKR